MRRRSGECITRTEPNRQNHDCDYVRSVTFKQCLTCFMFRMCNAYTTRKIRNCEFIAVLRFISTDFVCIIPHKIHQFHRCCCCCCFVCACALCCSLLADIPCCFPRTLQSDGSRIPSAQPYGIFVLHRHFLVRTQRTCLLKNQSKHLSHD